jgi:hypothetical protein
MLGGLAFVSAVSLRRGQPGNDECKLASGFCTECRLLPGCSLPVAAEERANTGMQ